MPTRRRLPYSPENLLSDSSSSSPSIYMAKSANLSKAAASDSAVKSWRVADDHRPVLPGLPDYLAQLCLSHLPPSLLFSVSRSWRRLLYSPSFTPFLSLYALLSSSDKSDSAQFFTFDPISSDWAPLPPPPADPPIHLLLRHPSFLSRNLPVQSISVNGQLVLLAATTHNFFPALSHPLVFDPISVNWGTGPPLATPRRWCATGSIGSAVYVASGIGSQFSSDVARSVEKWDLRKRKANGKEYWGWEEVCALRDMSFSIDAIDAVGWRGKLCMANAAKGVVYDVEKDVWEEMPEGMVAGWKGPVAAMDAEEMYGVDERKGSLRKYNPSMDFWEEIIESTRFIGAEQIAAGGGRVCIVCSGGREIAVVDVAATPPKQWTVDSPSEFEVMALHILPRMTNPDL